MTIGSFCFTLCSNVPFFAFALCTLLSQVMIRVQFGYTYIPLRCVMTKEEDKQFKEICQIYVGTLKMQCNGDNSCFMIFRWDIFRPNQEGQNDLKTLKKMKLIRYNVKKEEKKR